MTTIKIDFTGIRLTPPREELLKRLESRLRSLDRAPRMEVAEVHSAKMRIARILRDLRMLEPVADPAALQHLTTALEVLIAYFAGEYRRKTKTGNQSGPKGPTAKGERRRFFKPLREHAFEKLQGESRIRQKAAAAVFEYLTEHPRGREQYLGQFGKDPQDFTESEKGKLQDEIRRAAGVRAPGESGRGKKKPRGK
jgi:hypothetical protein